MSKQDIELTAYCGLYCGDCNRFRSRAADLSRDLLKELQRGKFEKYTEVACLKSRNTQTRKRLKYFKECCEVLEEIVRLQCNSSCRVGGGCPTFSCEILECCQNSRLEGCWQCNEFENCEKFKFLEPYHGDAALQNLRKIKELGLDKWAEYRAKFYVWQ